MTAHAEALAALRDWSPPTPEQAALRDRYVAHLAEHPDGLTRACRPDHLTASTLVLSADGRSVLLTLHAKAHRWFQLGGHIEPGDASWPTPRSARPPRSPDWPPSPSTPCRSS